MDKYPNEYFIDNLDVNKNIDDVVDFYCDIINKFKVSCGAEEEDICEFINTFSKQLLYCIFTYTKDMKKILKILDLLSYISEGIIFEEGFFNSLEKDRRFTEDEKKEMKKHCIII